MKKRNKLYIILALITIIGLFWAFIAAKVITKNFKKDILSSTLEKQQVTVHGLIITETKDNKKYWEIYSENGYYDSKDKVVLLENAMGNFYSNDKVVMSFKADKGTLTEETKKVVLYSNALIGYKSGELIRADRMTWQGQDEEIKAVGNIIIEQPDKIRIHAQNAYLSADWKNFKITGKTKTELFGGEKKKI